MASVNPLELQRLTDEGHGCLMCGMHAPIVMWEGKPHHQNGGDLFECTRVEPPAEEGKP